MCEVENGVGPSDEEVWLLNLDAVEKGTGRVLVKELVPKATLGSSTVAFTSGCVLYSKLRPNLNKVVLPDSEGYATSEMLPLCPNSAVLYRGYLAAYLRSERFVKRAVASTAGAKMPRVSRRTVLDSRIPLLSVDRQRDIVRRLDAVSVLLGLCDRQLSLLDALVKSRFIEMFGNPDSQCERLDSVAEIQGGITKNRRRESFDIKLPYLRVANVLSNSIDLSEVKEIGLTEQERETTKLRRGDLLIVEGNGSDEQIGRSAIWNGEIDPCTHQNHLIRVRFGDRVLPVFAQAHFSSSHGRGQIVSKAVGTSGLHTLSTGKIRSLKIPVPPLALQQEFADFAERVAKSQVVARRLLRTSLKVRKPLSWEPYESVLGERP